MTEREGVHREVRDARGRGGPAALRRSLLAVLVLLAAGGAAGTTVPVLGPSHWSLPQDGGLGNDYSYGVAIDSQGSVVVAATMMGDPGTDGLLDKRLADGTRDWSVVFDNTDSDSAPQKSGDGIYAVCVDKDDNVITSGSWSGNYYGGDSYHTTAIVRKYTSQGSLSWEWKGGPFYEAWSTARALTTDAQGNVYAAGNAFMDWGSSQHVWAIWKFDAGGVLQNGFPILYNYSTSAYIPDYAYSIAVDDEGAMIVAGVRGQADNADPYKRDLDWHVRKYRADGSLAWEDTYGGASQLADYARSVVVDAAGDVYVAGHVNAGTNNYAEADWDGLVIKYAKDTGQRLWTKTFATGTGNSGAYYAATICPRGLLLAGTDGSVGGATTETRLEIRALADGESVAEETYLPGTDTAAYAIAQRDGVIAFTGNIKGAIDYDVLTVVRDAAAPPPPPATSQFLLPTKITRKVNAKNPAKNVLTFSAALDTGPDAAAFADTAELAIGALRLPIASLVPDRKGVWRSRSALHSFAIVPGAAGSSRCTVSATLKGAQVLDVVADGAVDLTLACGNVSSEGTCTLVKGSFTLGRNALAVDTSVPRSAVATLLGPGRDSFTVKWVITPGEPPAQMSDIVFRFGPTYEKTVPGASFKRRKAVFSFTDKTNALPSMTVDTAKGFITVTGKKADLGAFVEGAQAVRLTAGPAIDPATVDVRMVRKGKSLKY